MFDKSKEFALAMLEGRVFEDNEYTYQWNGCGFFKLVKDEENDEVEIEKCSRETELASGSMTGTDFFKYKTVKEVIF